MTSNQLLHFVVNSDAHIRTHPVLSNFRNILSFQAVTVPHRVCLPTLEFAYCGPIFLPRIPINYFEKVVKFGATPLKFDNKYFSCEGENIAPTSWRFFSSISFRYSILIIWVLLTHPNYADYIFSSGKSTLPVF